MTADAPAWAVTGIGSLGHVDAAAAVRAVFDLGLDLPFWPQLPRRGAADTMVVEAALGTGWLQACDARGAAFRPLEVPGRALAEAVAASRPQDFVPRAGGFEAFLAACRTGAPRARVKGQWVGPATFLAACTLDRAVALRDERVLARAALDALHLQVLAQARALEDCATHVDLWLDEPLFHTVHDGGWFDAAAARAWYARLGAACGAGVRLGVHDCAALDPGLFDLGVAVVSFDATRAPRAPVPPALRAHLDAGWIAWGVVPAVGEAPSVAAVREVVAAWAESAGVAPRELGRRSLLVPACGLAGLDPEAGLDRLRLAQQVAAALRA